MTGLPLATAVGAWSAARTFAMLLRASASCCCSVILSLAREAQVEELMVAGKSSKKGDKRKAVVKLVGLQNLKE